MFYVSQAAQFAFTYPPEQRPVRLLQELKNHREEVYLDSSVLLNLSERLWPYVSVEYQCDLEALTADPDKAIKRLDGTIRMLEEDPEFKLDRLGGRQRDSRIGRFVAGLIAIFRKYSNLRPTTVTDPDSGAMISPFDSLVLEAFRTFWPEKEIPWGSVQTAIKEAVELERNQTPDPPSTA